ncbi:DUF1707 SHOCT-like domain-containing protein [Nocardia altamirensis]|uniref:DUF1707 SHOCT-like domain-containing protein n=1 Tax=Nocardia altamirensis TaxID=472158 RepID=UPI00084078B4|nr:DUF1707 domain-containing protein [Nocardia altamirensis]
MVELPGARITADARERALRELSAHLVAGRLSLVEFDERSTRAAAVTTKAELAALFADLPGQTPTAHAMAPRDPISTPALLTAVGATAVIVIALLTGYGWWLLALAGAVAVGGGVLAVVRARKSSGQ